MYSNGSFKESYRGGGNITFKGTLEGNTDFTTIIFQGELLMDAVPLHITHSVSSLLFCGID